MNPAQKRLLCILLCILALFIATLLWILNLVGIIIGPWAAVLSVLCTILGVVFAFLQWKTPFSTPIVPPPFPSESPPLTTNGLFHLPTSLGVNRRKGALIVTARRTDLGATIHLCSGFTSTLVATDFAANIAECESGNVSVFLAFFPGLEPGKYTVFLHTSSYYVTVSARQTAGVDCRFRSHRGGKHAHRL